MQHHRLLSSILGLTVLLLGGLGLGYTSSYWFGERAPTDPPPSSHATSETPKPVEVARTQGGTVPRDNHTIVPAAGPPSTVPVAAVPDSTKRALLVGVTTYDHLKGADLRGPVNDARLMREFLEKSYRFPSAAIVTLAESEGKPERRPTRANIEREFRALADAVHENDQVMILMAGHGAREPADPENREPDGINEIFLPADVKKWEGFPNKVPNAIRDKELAEWLAAITRKKAYVWIVFDCCHSATMAREAGETLREPRPEVGLVPQEELTKARDRAAAREATRGEPVAKSPAYVPKDSSEYLIALYACREIETTLESPQPRDSTNAQPHGLLTYTLVEVLTQSAASPAPLTYEELVHRIQVRYTMRPHGSPTPLIEGKGKDRVVLGADRVLRSTMVLTKRKDQYIVNAGDLHGLTAESVLAVYTPPGTEAEPKLLGHVRVVAAEPFEAMVEPCAHGKVPVPKDLPQFGECRLVAIDYGMKRLKVAIDAECAARQKIMKALEPITIDRNGLVTLVDTLPQADWVVGVEKGKLSLAEASGHRTPFSLPAPESANLEVALRKNLEAIFRARRLIAVAGSFEREREGGRGAIDVEVSLLRHKNKSIAARGELFPRPVDGWAFRPGDNISFRIKNTSESQTVDVTLLYVGSDFEIAPFYPKEGELAKSLKPGETIDTPHPWGEFTPNPPFGPECLVMIAVPAKNPPVNFSALAQEGLAKARSADRGNALKSQLGELLEGAMFGRNERGKMERDVVKQHGMRLLTWRTEPAVK